MIRRKKNKSQRKSKLVALRKMRRSLRRSLRLIKRQSDGGGTGSDGVNYNHESIRFFTNMKERQLISTTTKNVFTDFFNKFKSNEVFINKIAKTTFTEPPTVFSYMEESIKEHIKKSMKQTYTYKVDIKRPCEFSISSDGSETEKDIKNYLHMMVFWLNIVTQFADDSVCGNETLKVFLMLTDLKKELPMCSTNCKIKKTSVNTGYSLQCSHIVIFRKEEWFKVFIHETIHNFGLDFSPIDTNCYPPLLKYFGIKKNIQLKLYEAYTESWAKILNCLLLAFDDEKEDVGKFLKLANKNIETERFFGYYQICKILKYMDLTFGQMTTYEEETAVISYYFIGSILLSDYQDYIQWCFVNNKPGIILQFDKNNYDKKQMFCDYITSKCGEKSTFMEGLKDMKDIFKEGINFNDSLQITMKKSIMCRACEM